MFFVKINQIKQKMKEYESGKGIGFTYTSSLKALGLIPRADGTVRISPKYLKIMGKRVPKKIGGSRPEQHSDLYTNEDPSDSKQSKKYTRHRISKVAHVLEQRTRFMRGKKNHNEIAKEYIRYLAHRPSI
jgi:hypothetical protein